MRPQLIKTTVELDKNILYLAKKKALEEGKTLREIFMDSLKEHLKIIDKPKKKKIPKIGGHRLGNFKGSLRRVDIYDFI